MTTHGAEQMRLKLFILFTLLPTLLLAAKQPERKDIRTGNKEYKNGEYGEAELSYRRAMEKAPAQPNAKYNLGNALYKQIDSTLVQTAPEEAKQKLEQVHKLYENAAETYTDDKQKAAAYYNEGNTFLREQNFDAAIDAYKKSLRLNPSDMEAKQNLVFAQAMKNQQQQNPQQQQQNQDKNKDDKDKDKDKDQNKDQNQDKQDQQQQPQDNQDQNKDKKDQQQQQQEQKISKEDAQRMLQALEQQEKDTQEKVKKEKAQKAQQRNSGKNW